MAVLPVPQVLRWPILYVGHLNTSEPDLVVNHYSAINSYTTMSHRSQHSSGRVNEPSSSLRSLTNAPQGPSHRHHSRSPHRTHHKRKRSASPKPVLLPFNNRRLRKHDFDSYRPMFALYLDIQKHLILEDLEADEVKGRWKSFVGKWNRGELAEGWYDPTTLQKATQSSTADEQGPDHDRHHERIPSRHQGSRRNEESSEDEVLGPALPASEPQHGRGSQGRRTGPSIPSMQDLELQREIHAEDALAARSDMRQARKLDRTAQKAALDELVPRADAGTRERQLEKKREKTDVLRSFARAKSPGAVEEVREGDLMGDDDGGGIEGFKKQKKEFERKKNERELRKEEMLRVRAAEREERIREYQVKEDRTMDMLRALAEQRFG
ncbi:hypothetical protein MMC16_000193 [Acarospora aff. strigata]|nr:hypothetical protein [Acarospora aff. strigata]